VVNFFLPERPSADDRSRSDRALPEAVLGVGAGGGRPLPQWGSGGITPGSFYLFFSAVDEFWCILKTENKIILKGFDSSKNTIKSHIATSDDLNTVYS
jgi:hypothetical protein